MHAFSAYSMERFLVGMQSEFAIKVHDGPSIDVSFQTLPKEPTVLFMPTGNPASDPGFSDD